MNDTYFRNIKQEEIQNYSAFVYMSIVINK